MFIPAHFAIVHQKDLYSEIVSASYGVPLRLTERRYGVIYTSDGKIVSIKIPFKEI